MLPINKIYIKPIFSFVCLFVWGCFFSAENVHWFTDYEDTRCHITNDYKLCHKARRNLKKRVASSRYFKKNNRIIKQIYKHVITK